MYFNLAEIDPALSSSNSVAAFKGETRIEENTLTLSLFNNDDIQKVQKMSSLSNTERQLKNRQICYFATPKKLHILSTFWYTSKWRQFDEFLVKCQCLLNWFSQCMIPLQILAQKYKAGCKHAP